MMPHYHCISLRHFHHFDLLRFPSTASKTTPICSNDVPYRIYLLAILLALIPLARHFIPIFLGLYEPPYRQKDDTNPINLDINFIVEPAIEDDLRMLVMVNSMPDRFNEREMIRKSWAVPDLYDERTTRVLFLIGRPATIELEELLAIEEGKFHDIVVAGIHEDYYSLSLKTYAMLYFKDMRVPSAKCLVKADSDNVLVIRNYERLCEETSMVRF
ncbi:hypothetical protein V3C99_007726 [Haemonchus contortus]